MHFWRACGTVTQVGKVGQPFNVSLREGLDAPLRLWSPNDPHLYNLQVALLPSANPKVWHLYIDPLPACPWPLSINEDPISLRTSSVFLRLTTALQGCFACAPEAVMTTDVCMPPGQEPLDAVASYVGMRKVSLGRVGPGNHMRPLLNNEFVFAIGFLDQACCALTATITSLLGQQHALATEASVRMCARLRYHTSFMCKWTVSRNWKLGCLQGFWPDGLYTAPTDAALAADIMFAKSLGYNLLRKHIKARAAAPASPLQALLMLNNSSCHAARASSLVWRHGTSSMV